MAMAREETNTSPCAMGVWTSSVPLRRAKMRVTLGWTWLGRAPWELSSETLKLSTTNRTAQAETNMSFSIMAWRPTIEISTRTLRKVCGQTLRLLGWIRNSSVSTKTPTTKRATIIGHQSRPLFKIDKFWVNSVDRSKDWQIHQWEVPEIRQVRYEIAWHLLELNKKIMSSKMDPTKTRTRKCQERL